jgi:hypothetical protein
VALFMRTVGADMVIASFVYKIVYTQRGTCQRRYQFSITLDSRQSTAENQ